MYPNTRQNSFKSAPPFPPAVYKAASSVELFFPECRFSPVWFALLIAAAAPAR